MDRPSLRDLNKSEEEVASSGAQGAQPGPLLSVLSELEDDLPTIRYEENKLTEYVEEVTLSGPTPPPAQPAGFFRVAGVGRRRGRKKGVEERGGEGC